MITSFGKFCRNLRMDNSELLYEMAQRLKVSPAFLSRVENGKAKPPAEWLEIIATEYHLNDKQIEKLKNCITESRENVLKMEDLSQDDRNMIFAFAKRLNTLSVEERRKWKKMLKIPDACDEALSKKEKEAKKYCCTCVHYTSEEGVCVNSDSEYCADFRCLDDSCAHWKEQRERKN